MFLSTHVVGQFGSESESNSHQSSTQQNILVSVQPTEPQSMVNTDPHVVVVVYVKKVCILQFTTLFFLATSC